MKNFWTNIWNSIVNFFTDNIFNIVLFISILIIGLIVIKLVLSALRKVFAKSKLDKTLKGFILSISKFIMLLIYFMTLCSIIGIPITSLVAIITALSLAVGLAIQSAISNVANGIILLATKPFKQGDYVEIGTTSGNIIELKMLHTTLLTPTNELITIPNSQMGSVVIKNYSAEPTRRIDITVGVDYSANIEQVKQLLTVIASEHESVIKEQPILVRLLNCNTSSLDFTMRVWVDNVNYWSTKFDLQERIVNALRENKISIPYQTLDVNIRNANDNAQNK